MVLVDRFATVVRDSLTTFALHLSVGSSTTETITITSTTINAVITTVARESVSYPDIKKFTGEFIIPSTLGNGSTFRRIAVKQADVTTDVISLSNVPATDKNELIEVAYDVTFDVINE